MKLKAALLMSSLFCTAAMASGTLSIPQNHGTAVEINGEVFFKAENKAAVSSYSGHRVRRSLADNSIYSGDVVFDKSGLIQYTATGAILVRADRAKAQQLAQAHGLNLITVAGDIAVLKAEKGKELTVLTSALTEQGKLARIELINDKMQPE